MRIKEELYGIADALSASSVPYALCGGLAVVVHGYPRLTRDIDVLIRPEDLERAREAVAKIGFDIPSGLLPFDAGTPTERQVFRVGKVEGDDHLTLDFILVARFLEAVWESKISVEVDGRVLPIVSIEGLIAMKKVAGRPQDLADLAHLEGPGGDDDDE